jgi:hypothetical protein
VGCSPPAGGVSLEGVDVTKETVIGGRVRLGGNPVAGAYVRLLDSGGDFTGEVVTDDAGGFRFLARPGEWSVRVLSPHGNGGRAITAELGLPADATVDL